jgi:hypothetical protein
MSKKADAVLQAAVPSLKVKGAVWVRQSFAASTSVNV